MPCNTCNQVKDIPDTSGLLYTLAPGVSTVVGLRDNHYSIGRSLITRPHVPRGSWRVTFWVNGQEHNITAANPGMVFSKVKELFDLNAVPYTALNLWFNLNLQWLERAIEKYQNVTYNDLIKLAQ